MKIAILFFILFSITALGQTEAETINQANDLIKNKKYETAFKLLETYDPTNDKPDIVLLKNDILLNYFVTSIMHQIFSLKDIGIDEDIIEYRKNQSGTSSMHMFQIDSILVRLIKKNPNNCSLYKGLGDYYYDAHLRYGGNWLKTDKELFGLIQTNYQKAIDGNCEDYLSHYVLGYIKLIQEKNKESIPYFIKSIELNNEYASSHYNLAYAYLFLDDRTNALNYAKNAFELYEDRIYKSDAARMIGQIYLELKDNENAIINFEQANNIDPENYYNLRPLLDLYVELNDKKVKETTVAFFNLAPENPTIYYDLEEIYYKSKKTNDLIDFYKSQLLEFKNNEQVLGNLNFYLARLYLEIDKKIASEYFLKAKEIFEKSLEKNHPVFKAINDGLKQCKK